MEIRNEPLYIDFSPHEISSSSLEVTASETETSQKFNINTATAEELQTLNGIGEVLASRIVEYRESIGSFLFIEDIMEVSGIGSGLFERIKDLITI